MSYLKGWQHVQSAVARLRARCLRGTASSDKSIVNDGMLFIMNSDIDVRLRGDPHDRKKG